MPDRLAAIETILDEVEEKGSQFLEPLLESDLYEVAVGKVEVLREADNRPFMLLRPNGLPVWFEVTLTARGGSAGPTGLALNYLEYEGAYLELRERHLQAALQEQPLDLSDALEGLILAELIKDWPVAESLLQRVSNRSAKNAHWLTALLGRGNTRIRSAIGRAIVHSQDEASLAALFDYLPEESADGVRADIIVTYVQENLAGEGLKEKVLRAWLGGSALCDALSVALAFYQCSGGQKLPAQLQEAVNPTFRQELSGWFAA